ncbi:TIGR04325 family methyltransferase [Paraburkholderia adhaesiva]|uniref:TIGR04325 family methyltransferase n=1 Tax=Paraburkholderia adhaesiva TaxID=2883244 RepID=UPI001F28E9BA|nr:TIGR04325 family methyltransferase [Paraburkholderia adhaesiva]
MSTIDSAARRQHLRRRVLRIAREFSELPVIRLLSAQFYRRYFRKPSRGGNLYFGVYGTYQEALNEAQRISSERLPSTYDVEAVTTKYLDQLDSLPTCYYPSLFWINRILSEGGRRVFDLGGHLGLAYYGYQRYISFPADLVWCVHDLPHVVAAGRCMASERDKLGALQFCETPHEANGFDVLICSGALQYLGYSLPSLIGGLSHPPRHVLFNLIPLHPEKAFFTLQNLGVAVCPYRVESIERLVADMKTHGYRVRDHWDLDRRMRIPFKDEYEVESYYGYYFERVVPEV